MSLLDRATKGKIKKPHLILIYGTDGVGKTTFAASAPKPIIIGAESGSSNLDVTRLEPKSFEEIMQAIEELKTTKHDYETAILDSLDWIEPMVWKSVCDAGKVTSIENYGGGYGKGYTEANAYWLRMITALRSLREARHMNIIMIAHSQIKAFNDPSQLTPYDRYILKLNEKAAALWREFVDTVIFANYEVFVKKENNKGKAFGDGLRIMHTERRPGFDAKNRFNLPAQLPLSWTDYDTAMNSLNPEDPAPIRESIAAMAANITDQELKDKVFETVVNAGDNAKQLQAIKDRLTIKLGADRMEIQPGKYVAKVTDYSANETDKGTISVIVRFGFDGDKSLVWNGYMTEKAAERTAETLVLLGLEDEEKYADLVNGPPSGLLDTNKEVEIVVEMETYMDKTRPRIKFVNSLGGGSFRDVMDKDSFRSKTAGLDFKNKIKAAKAKLGPQKPRAVVNDLSEIPF